MDQNLRYQRRIVEIHKHSNTYMICICRYECIENEIGERDLKPGLQSGWGVEIQAELGERARERERRREIAREPP